jgi:hypothetical protein
MPIDLTDDQIELIARRRRAGESGRLLADRSSEWFPQQRAFYNDGSRLTAALCGRRAGKTRGACLSMLLEGASTRNGRFLYLNLTRAECMKLAWHGLRGDGMYSLVMKLKLPAVCNATNLSIHFPQMDSWIYLMGADDEAGVRKALGLAYHLVHWDEAQGIPPKLEPTITSVLLPTLLDYGGRFRLTGTPVRNMSGLFYNVTRRDGKQLNRWSVHRWNMLDNPFFGRAVQDYTGKWYVNGKDGRRVDGPFKAEDECAESVRATRMTDGVLDLQDLFGGPEAAPLDSPIMRREAFGNWVTEDALFVYDVHKVERSRLIYAPARWRSIMLRVPRMNGEAVEIEEIPIPNFPDIMRAIEDLPGYPNRDYFFGLAADIGFSPDPFAFSLGAWSMKDPALYEVGTWTSTELDAPVQAAVLRYLCDLVHVGVVAADAGGSVLATVKGWSREWSSRYGIPFDEMEKSNKNAAIQACNGDIVRGQYRLRDGSPLIEQFSSVQWSPSRTGTGKFVEDPTIPNDACDAGLYLHRRSFQHRYRPPEARPEVGSPEYDAATERKMMEDFEDEFELASRW